MTNKREQAKKTSEMSELFLMLDQVQQEYALGILRALNFAQSLQITKKNKEDVEEGTDER